MFEHWGDPVRADAAHFASECKEVNNIINQTRWSVAPQVDMIGTASQVVIAFVRIDLLGVTCRIHR
jgi:hypothetical protein